MRGMQWRTIGALFSVGILGASLTLEIPTLSAKDLPQKSTATADKTAKKKKTEKKSGRNTADGDQANEGSAGSVGGTTVGGGGFGGSTTGGTGGSNSTKSSSGGTTGRGSTAPGIGGIAPRQQNAGTPRKAGSGRSLVNSKRNPLNINHPLVKKVVDVQNRNQKDWLAQKGVAGAATGLDEDGNVVIRVYVTGADSPQLPSQIEGVAVNKILTGPLHFAQTSAAANLPPTPAPIGVSSFIDTQGQAAIPCQGSNGTVGCRIVDSNSQIYAISCNHVYAGNLTVIASFDSATQTNTDQTVTFFATGTNALQPAGNNVGCKTPSNNYSNILGTLFVAAPFYAYYIDPFTGNPQFTSTDPHLDSSGNPTNFSDCALVTSSSAALDTATPPDGYGIPTNTYTPATLGMAVQKYGAVTRLTTGTVSALNATYNIQVDLSTQNVLIKTGYTTSITNGTVTVTYTSGFAGLVTVPFSQQIEITPSGTSSVFAQTGDSGSLVVDSGNNPVCMVQALGTGTNVLCGDWNNILNDLVRAIATATGNQVALKIDTSPSALQQSQDGKVGRSSPNKP